MNSFKCWLSVCFLLGSAWCLQERLFAAGNDEIEPADLSGCLSSISLLPKSQKPARDGYQGGNFKAEHQVDIDGLSRSLENVEIESFPDEAGFEGEDVVDINRSPTEDLQRTTEPMAHTHQNQISRVIDAIKSNRFGIVVSCGILVWVVLEYTLFHSTPELVEWMAKATKLIDQTAAVKSG